jgi:type IV pilus assembly protein PilN
MIRINLLPYRAARTKENVRKQVSVFILGMILLLVILIVGQGYLSARTSAMVDELDGLKKEVTRYEETAKKVEEYKAELLKLQQQIEVVVQLEAKREASPILLAKIADQVVTGRMQFTRMKVTDSAVEIDGLTLDNETVAEFMTRLERSGLFTEVALTSSKQTIQFDVEVKEFKLVCRRKVQKAALAEVETPADAKKPGRK